MSGSTSGDWKREPIKGLPRQSSTLHGAPYRIRTGVLALRGVLWFCIHVFRDCLSTLPGHPIYQIPHPSRTSTLRSQANR